jgi:alanine racemase
MTASPAPTRAARLIVDLNAVAANYRHLQSLAPSSAMAAVVKANAYGLGAADLAQRLAREGCKEFFVATPDEGGALRAALGGDAVIWVLNGFEPVSADAFSKAQLRPVLNSPEQVAAFRAAGSDAGFALHVDTGMNRLGVSAEDAAALAVSGLQPGLVMSHLACSEESSHPMNAQQLGRFQAIAAHFPTAKRSLSNTGGVYLGEDFHFDLCRPGIGLAGATARPGQAHGLTPAARLEAPILQLHALQPGDTVGYGSTFIAERPLLAATAAAGYADGLPRALSNTGWARVGGIKAPILGRVSMDLVVLDVTDAEDAARAGAAAEFLGPDLDALAAEAATLPYELLTGIGPGVARVAA